MARAASVVFVASFLLLNVFFAWDSRLLRTISPSLASVVAAPIQWQLMSIWSYFNLARISGYAYIVVDIECFALLIIAMASFAWLRRGRGLRAALLRSTQVAALGLVIFGAELGLFDCGEFFIHVTDFQEVFNFLPWFTNAHLLFSSLAVLVTSTLLLNRSRLGARWARSAGGSLKSLALHPTVASQRNLDRFLILFAFGTLFVVGGLVLAYYGGVWRFSYYTTSGVEGNSAANILHSTLTTYSGCLTQSRFFSALVSNSSCSIDSLNSSELAFVGLGGISMLIGLFSLRRRPTIVTEGINRFWWVLALVVPLFGGIIGYIAARHANSGGGGEGTNMIIIGIGTLVVFVLLLNVVNLVEFRIIIPACALPSSPY